MKVKLQPPSGTELAAFNPILPPASITQIMLLANPTKVSQPHTRQCHITPQYREAHASSIFLLTQVVRVFSGKGSPALQAGVHAWGCTVQRGGGGGPVPTA